MKLLNLKRKITNFLFWLTLQLYRSQLFIYVIGLVAIILLRVIEVPYERSLFYSILGLMISAFASNVVFELMHASRARSGVKIPTRIRVSFLLGVAGIAFGVYALLAYNKLLGLILLLGAYFYLNTAFKAYEDFKKSVEESKTSKED